MTISVYTLSFLGVESIKIEIQISVLPGLPSFNIVGLPNKTVAESKERVRSALYSLGSSLPMKRIIINLSPSDLQKEGSHFDLPIALAILSYNKELDSDCLKDSIAIGALSLNGDIMPVKRTLLAGLHCKKNNMRLICSKNNFDEASKIKSINIISANNLASLIHNIKNNIYAKNLESQNVIPNQPNVNSSSDYDLTKIQGNDIAKKAVLIAAAGRHNMLLIGSPGVGKTLLALSLYELLPSLNEDEIIDINIIANLSQQKYEWVDTRPFRTPHHTCSEVAMVGGGKIPRPGEITLAHHGVLFLDELAEFNKYVLDVLRQPLEKGYIDIARANAHITFPAHFQLIAATNPCKCGYLYNNNKKCKQAPYCGEKYLSKISGPLLDRFDLVTEVTDNNTEYELTSNKKEDSLTIKEQLSYSRERQAKRFKNITTKNADLKFPIDKEILQITKEGESFLNHFANKKQISMRSYVHVMNIARTIADLENSEFVHIESIKEALFYKKNTLLDNNNCY